MIWCPSGVTTNAEAGQTVTISPNGRIHTTTGGGGRQRQLDLHRAVSGIWLAWKDGDASVQVSVTTVNGNSRRAVSTAWMLPRRP